MRPGDWSWNTQTLVAEVYFIECNEYLKIGFTTNVEKRLLCLQPSNPHKLKLIGTIRATRVIERALHTRYDHLWVHSEWFKPDEDMIKEVKLMCSTRRKIKTKDDLFCLLRAISAKDT